MIIHPVMELAVGLVSIQKRIVTSSFIRILLFCLWLILICWMPASFAATPQPKQQEIVDLQLRWHHQFQFAGYYAALEKGFYKDEGLDVRLHIGDPMHQPVSEVLSGRAQYGEGNSEVLYQRLQGKPLIALAVIFQHSPSVLITLQSSGIRSVHELIGKNVMLANKREDADFLTMLLNEGISLSQINIIPSSYQLDDLISGKVDAFNSYTTNEPYFLKKHNIAYNIIDPANYRVDFYSDIFFTSEAELRYHPKRVEAMRRATLKGWRYAMDNPEEIIDLLITKYQVKKTRDHLRFEAAEIRKLILPRLIQIGHMNPGRWQHMADTFVQAGLVKDDEALDGFIYDTSNSHLPVWVLPALIAAFILVIMVSFITYYLHRFNRRIALSRDSLQESEERFKALSDASYGGIVIHDQGLILECNKGLSDITGFRYSELIGMNGFDLIAAEDLNTVLENMRSASTHSYETVGVHKDGSKYPLSIKGKNITYKGHVARVTEFIDITERKKAEEQLKLAASVFTHAREGIMITDSKGAIIDVNDTFSHITGYSREEVLGKNPRFLKSNQHSRDFYSAMWASLLTKKQWSGELWNRRKNGELFFELATISAVSDAKGKTQNYVALFSDITQMKKHQQQLEHIVHYDPLTNLANRVLLDDRLHHAMSQCERRGQSLAVVYLDLDGFKAINDAQGHDVGDELLITLSQRMNTALREGDTLARIGGDEFVAVLVDLENMSEWETVLKRLLQAAASPVSTRNTTLQVSTSIGVTLYPQDGADADQLIRHADQAMYVAKQKGKNRYHLFDVHEDKSIKTRRESISDIERALKQNEFVLYYQPKVNMKTGIVIGAEALIRWPHPEHGLMFPGDFLDIIEDHPISIDLGEWVIDTALSQMTEWQSAGLDIPVSVNIDALQLQQPDFVVKLLASLAKYPMINPRSLELEILETSSLADIAEVSAIMKACIDSGVNFALDDFGTGFSSLTYLKRLPAELLKIDQSFVRDMLESPDDRAIVMGIISLSGAFNRRVIAEGVESIEHGTQLLAMGCYLAQGYDIARPMPAADIPAWVAQWKPHAVWK
jgi:diguanylate cyclase (GGDEF)-like protein/PAS domain S-box-containing protein